MSRVLPILFNMDMVKAILDGRKTVTRRLVKQSLLDKWEAYDEYATDKANGLRASNIPVSVIGFRTYMEDYKPYQPGDILYVRETWMDYAGRNMYKADCDEYRIESLNFAGFKWRPSIHMPKEAARIWLKVTNVRLERLQDIDAIGCLQEGIESEYPNVLNGEEELYAFSQLWNSTIKKSDLDRYGWDASPWVWVIEFERCEKPEEVSK